MAGTFESNQKLLEKKLQEAGLYSTAIRPAMNECAKIMTRLHHYNAEHIKQKYRTSLPDGKRPPELLALESASRELLNYLKALGLVAEMRKQDRQQTATKENAPVSSPMAALERILAQHEADDGP